MKIRRRYCFQGEVQGVGFRYRAYHAANSFGVTGWVENEFDGSVILEAQGEPEEIDTVVQRILAGKYIHADRIDVKELLPHPNERSFEIRGW